MLLQVGSDGEGIVVVQLYYCRGGVLHTSKASLRGILTFEPDAVAAALAHLLGLLGLNRAVVLLVVCHERCTKIT